MPVSPCRGAHSSPRPLRLAATDGPTRGWWCLSLVSWLREVHPRLREVPQQSERSTTVAAPRGSSTRSHHTPGDLQLPARIAPGRGEAKQGEQRHRGQQHRGQLAAGSSTLL
eukprot:COSAG01_NODE_8682_length_2697_cov_23.461124_3_plen_112_part_00